MFLVPFLTFARLSRAGDAFAPDVGVETKPLLKFACVASTRLLKQNATGTSDSHNKVYYNERQGRPIGTNTLDKSAPRTAGVQTFYNRSHRFIITWEQNKETVSR